MICQSGVVCFIIYVIANGLEGTIELKRTKLKLTIRLVPTEYYKYLLVFSKEQAQTSPPRYYVDHTIPIMYDRKPPFGSMYSISDQDLKELR